ncbi:hypothetical protein [Kribbella catacumbae]|uniref:hypothetical protein n=1 Tax=Kribbella catacumbae TaxID=460086 RepID=UPI000379EF5C|nr:hypothetical protein [Kribbella catacumbae]
MTSRAGETFDVDRAAAEVDDLLAAQVPADGPTEAKGDPATGEWTVTVGAGFRIVPLWEGEPLTGLYGAEWNDEADAGDARLASLTKALEARWGPHRTVRLDGPFLRWQGGSPIEALFEALFAEDLYGDLNVWGPVDSTGRCVAATVGHSDGDAPLVLAALVTDRPITEPAGVEVP